MKRIVTYPKWLTRSLAFLVTAFIALNVIFPPPLDAVQHNSAVVTDRDGHWLAGFTVDDGIWRIPAKLEEIDHALLKRSSQSRISGFIIIAALTCQPLAALCGLGGKQVNPFRVHRLSQCNSFGNMNRVIEC